MREREAKDRTAGKESTQNALRKSLQYLVRLYEATGRADQAAKWKKKLEQFDQPSGPSGV